MTNTESVCTASRVLIRLRNTIALTNCPLYASMDPTPASDNAAPVAFVKRKSKGNVRKRPLDETEEPADPQAAISAAVAASGKRSRAVKGGTAFSTKKDDDDKLQTFKYSSSKTLQQQSDQGATAVLQTETQHDRDARYVGVLLCAL